MASSRRAHASPLLVRMAVAVGLAATLVIATGDRVTGDHEVPCHGDQRWPSFREVAPTAKRIVVGTVIDGGGEDFTLLVEEVPRGTAPARLRIKRLPSGLPGPHCAGRWLLGSFGARMAIAFRGRGQARNERLTTAARLLGRPTRHVNPGIERLSIREVRRLAGHAEDGSTLPPGRGIRIPPVGLGDLAGVATEIGARIDLVVRDAVARHRCETELDTLSGVVVSPGTAGITAACGMTGPQMYDYFQLKARMGLIDAEMAEKSTWRDVPGAVSVCILDGATIRPASSSEDIVAKRAVVFIAKGVRMLGVGRRHRRSEFPLLFHLVR